MKDAEPSSPTPVLQSLPRGGLLLEWGRTRIQFGVPPETIKDTAPTPAGVPEIFVLMRRVFDFERAVSLAEIEFPIYYNFFLKRRRVIVVGEAWQRSLIQAVVREVLFPPIPQNMAREFVKGAADPALPDIARELAHFQRHPWETDRNFVFEDVVDFREISTSGEVTLDQVVLSLDRLEGRWEVRDGNGQRALIPWDFEVPAPPPAAEMSGSFRPPDFGITALGTGSGFDHSLPTCGFIFWIDGRGVMVDPPVDSLRRLKIQRIHPKLIQDVILTHCHADHDAGLLQKILEDGVIRLHTTRTIFDAYLRKSSLITRVPASQLEKMIQFHPVVIGRPTLIQGARFRFWYNLHALPTIGMQARFGGKTIAYSSDAHNVPETWAHLLDAGVLTPGRYAALMEFPWDSNVILHEAGIPPLHTPVPVLANLSQAVKKRLFVVHLHRRQLEPYPDLQPMGEGIEHTVVVPVKMTAADLQYRRLQAIANVDFLRNLPVDRAADLAAVAEERALPEGEYLIRRGDPGQEIFLLMQGEVSVMRDGRQYKVYGAGEAVGDMALVSSAPRFADVVTRSPIEYLAIARADFLSVLHGTGVIEYLQHLAEIRKHESWPLLEESPVFNFLSTSQKTQLQGILDPMTFVAGAPLQSMGDQAPFGYLLTAGRVDLYHGQHRVGTLEPGFFVGLVDSDESGGTGTLRAFAATRVEAYRMHGRAFKTFLEHNPGVWLRLRQRCLYENQLKVQSLARAARSPASTADSGVLA